MCSRRSKAIVDFEEEKEVIKEKSLSALTALRYQLNSQFCGVFLEAAGPITQEVKASLEILNDQVTKCWYLVGSLGAVQVYADRPEASIS